MKKFVLLSVILPVVTFAQSPNFSEDIAPVFYAKYTQCHHTGGLTCILETNKGRISGKVLKQ